MLKKYADEIARMQRDLQAARDRNGIYLAIQTQLAQPRDTIKEQEERNAAVELEMVKLNDLTQSSSWEDTTKELEETGKELEETSDNQCVMTTQLRHMTQDRDEHKHLVGVRVNTESQLHSQATQQLKTATMSTSDVSGLHAKLDRKHNVESHNASVQEKFRVRFHEGIDDRSTSQQPCYTTVARIVSTLFQLRFSCNKRNGRSGIAVGNVIITYISNSS